MENRPRITITVTSTDRISEAVGWGLVLSMWMITAIYFTKLPQIIPIHFNASGAPDGYGVKYILLLTPFIATVLCVALTWLCRYPHLFNYPTPITASNASQQYAVAIRMLRWLKLIIAAIFLFITTHTLSSATGNKLSRGFWILPVASTALFTVVGTSLISSAKTN